MIEQYRNFQIALDKSGLYIISKNGKKVFTAHWQTCFTIEEARTIIDSSIAFERLPNKQAALSKLNTQCELENGAEKADQFSNWVNREEEKRLEEISDY